MLLVLFCFWLGGFVFGMRVVLLSLYALLGLRVMSVAQSSSPHEHFGMLHRVSVVFFIRPLLHLLNTFPSSCPTRPWVRTLCYVYYMFLIMVGCCRWCWTCFLMRSPFPCVFPCVWCSVMFPIVVVVFVCVLSHWFGPYFVFRNCCVPTTAPRFITWCVMFGSFIFLLCSRALFFIVPRASFSLFGVVVPFLCVLLLWVYI